MKKKGLIVLTLLAVYVLSFGGIALTVASSDVTNTLSVVSIQSGDPTAPLTTIIPFPPPPPPPKPTAR
jgi:hypothetical protein